MPNSGADIPDAAPFRNRRIIDPVTTHRSKSNLRKVQHAYGFLLSTTRTLGKP